MTSKTKRIIRNAVIVVAAFAVLAAIFFSLPFFALSCHTRKGDIDVRGHINAELDMKIPSDWTLLYENDGYPAGNRSCISVLTPPCYAVYEVKEPSEEFFADFSSEHSDSTEKEFTRNINLMDENDRGVPDEYLPPFSDSHLWKKVSASEKYFVYLTMIYEPEIGRLYVVAAR